jgi:RNA polymerase sigma factor (TIGR02999 family)
MSSSQPSAEGSEITRLLLAVRDGRAGALDQLLPLIYDELRHLARSVIGDAGNHHTLEATALVHEAWMRLAAQHSLGFEHRGQFFSAAATVMRRVLVDHVRSRRTEKRGGAFVAQPLDETVAAFERGCGDLLELETALEALASRDALKAKLVELRFFAGLDMAESASVLAISKRQAEREWTTARAFLRHRLTIVSEN